MDALDRINEQLGEEQPLRNKLCKPLTLTERLTHQKEALEGRLVTINAALDALNKNPEVANVIELVLQAR